MSLENYQREFEDSVIAIRKVPDFRHNFRTSFYSFSTTHLIAGVQWRPVFLRTVLNGRDTLTLKFTPDPLVLFSSFRASGVLVLMNEKYPERVLRHRFEGTFSKGNPIVKEHMIETDVLCAEDGGYLSEGHLGVLIECRLYWFTDLDGIRHFNYFDPTGTSVKISCENWGTPFHVERQILKMHWGAYDEYFANGEGELPYGTDPFSFEQFLESLHGVFRVQHLYRAPEVVLKHALSKKCHNVVRLYERQLIHGGSIAEEVIGRLTYFVKHLMKMAKTLEDVKRHVSHIPLDSANTEVLKTIAQKFFSFSVSPMSRN